MELYIYKYLSNFYIRYFTSIVEKCYNWFDFPDYKNNDENKYAKIFN